MQSACRKRAITGLITAANKIDERSVLNLLNSVSDSYPICKLERYEPGKQRRGVELAKY